MALFIDSHCSPGIYFSPAPIGSSTPSSHSDGCRSLDSKPRYRPATSLTSAPNPASAYTSSSNQNSTPIPPSFTTSSYEDGILKRILKETNGVNDHQIQIPGIDEATYDRIKDRTDAISEGLRYHYDVNSCSIIIDTLPSDIHESIQEYLTDTLRYNLRHWVAKFFTNAKVKITGSISRDLFSTDGSRLKGKTPDQGFRVTSPKLAARLYPNIIVEVGYSESHRDLLDDARRWLTQAREDPVLCVLIFLFRKPSESSHFADLSKWKAFLEVYEPYVNQVFDYSDLISQAHLK
jgi:hypothetical protein